MTHPLINNLIKGRGEAGDVTLLVRYFYIIDGMPQSGRDLAKPTVILWSGPPFGRNPYLYIVAKGPLAKGHLRLREERERHGVI